MNLPLSVKEIINRLDRCLDNLEGPAIAAFDADGTLWPLDVGTIFFQYQIEKNLLPDLPLESWAIYKNMRGAKGQNLSQHGNGEGSKKNKEKDQRTAQALSWLAQINEGQSLQRVKEWASQAIEASDFSIFEDQRTIVNHLHKRAVEIFIVSASVKWSIEPAAKLYNIDSDHVLGVTTRVVDGVVTDEPIYPITYKEGKVEGLLQKTNGRRPFFCSGNTEADLPLLKLASHISMAVASAPYDHEYHPTEQALQKVASQNNWYSLNYVAHGGHRFL